MTLQQIKDSLPKYILLRKNWTIKHGDERAYCSDYGAYFDIDQKSVGKTPAEVDMTGEFLYSFRRRIPDEVLENQAFWVLYNKLATVKPYDSGLRMLLSRAKSTIIIAPVGGDFTGFESETKAFDAIPLLGGEQNIIKHLSAGDLYSIWLGEQLT